MRLCLIAALALGGARAQTLPPTVYGRCPFSIRPGDASECVVPVPAGSVVAVGGCSPGAEITGDPRLSVVGANDKVLGESDDAPSCKNRFAPHLPIETSATTDKITVRISCHEATACSGTIEVTDPFDVQEVATLDAYARLSSGCSSVLPNCLPAPDIMRAIRQSGFSSTAATPRRGSSCTGTLAPSFDNASGKAIMTSFKLDSGGALPNTLVVWTGADSSPRVVVVRDDGKAATVVTDRFIRVSDGTISVPVDFSEPIAPTDTFTIGVFPVEGKTPMFFSKRPSFVEGSEMAATFGWCLEANTLSPTVCTPLVAVHYDTSVCPALRASSFDSVCEPATFNANTQYFISLPGSNPPLCLNWAPWSDLLLQGSNPSTYMMKFGTQDRLMTNTDGSLGTIRLAVCDAGMTFQIAPFPGSTSTYSIVKTGPNAAWNIHGFDNSQSAGGAANACGGGLTPMVLYNDANPLNVGAWSITFSAQPVCTATFKWVRSANTQTQCPSGSTFVLGINNGANGESPWYSDPMAFSQSSWQVTTTVPTNVVPQPAAPPKAPPFPAPPPGTSPPPPPIDRTETFVSQWTAIIFTCNTRDNSQCLTYNMTELLLAYKTFANQYITRSSSAILEFFEPFPADEIGSLGGGTIIYSTRTVTRAYRFVNDYPTKLKNQGIADQNANSDLFARLPSVMTNDKITADNFRFDRWNPPSPPAPPKKKAPIFKSDLFLGGVIGGGGGLILIVFLVIGVCYYYRNKPEQELQPLVQAGDGYFEGLKKQRFGVSLKYRDL